MVLRETFSLRFETAKSTVYPVTPQKHHEKVWLDLNLPLGRFFTQCALKPPPRPGGAKGRPRGGLSEDVAKAALKAQMFKIFGISEHAYAQQPVHSQYRLLKG